MRETIMLPKKVKKTEKILSSYSTVGITLPITQCSCFITLPLFSFGLFLQHMYNVVHET